MSNKFENTAVAYVDDMAPKMDNRPKETAGISFVSQVVGYQWKCGWQEWAHVNDDAVDGLIILRRKGVDTGAVVFAQVKFGSSYGSETKKRPDCIDINLGEAYIAKHLPRWKRLPGPVILIYVRPSDQVGESLNHDAWWVDLRSPDLLDNDNRQIVLVPKANKFNKDALGEIRKLYMYKAKDRVLPTIWLTLQDSHLVCLRRPLLEVAGEYYSDLKNNPPRHARLGEIEFGRAGWRHIMTPKRGLDSISISLNLLPAARIILEKSDYWINLGREKKMAYIDRQAGRRIEKSVRLIGVRANVVGRNIAQRTVQVVLLQVIIAADDKIETIRYRFYSVHELRRGREQIA
jgi:hypothetical protein